MARTGVHMLEKRVGREQSWQNLTRHQIRRIEQVIINKSNRETPKSRIGES